MSKIFDKASGQAVDLSNLGTIIRETIGTIGTARKMGFNPIFMGSSALQFAISVIGVFVFVGLTAWDTQNIKEQYAENMDQESQQKLAVFGALSLYLNFVNLFQLLLSLTGQREE